MLGTGPAACSNGTADGYPCNGLRLRKNVGPGRLGGGAGNDIWGWEDPQTGVEYALAGRDNGVVFLDLGDPDNPTVVGRLPTATVSSSWRDIKVANDHAYVVADSAANHGMQVFDLTRLRGATGNPAFQPELTYSDFGSAHNLAINEQSNFAYAVGTNTCAGGLHMMDISDPANPLFAGCHGANGDIHDAQCVNYSGPDADHAGKELCFAANEDHVAIIDVTSKSSPLTLATLTWPDLRYAHQNWLTEDHRYLLVGDELDERDLGNRTRTIVIDVSDLDAPVFLYAHTASNRSIDHNMYVVGNRLYQANYSAGLRVLQFSDLASNTLTEIASFDTRPEDDNASFNGAWSVYPFFNSGTIVVSDIERGVFVLSP